MVPHAGRRAKGSGRRNQQGTAVLRWLVGRNDRGRRGARSPARARPHSPRPDARARPRSPRRDPRPRAPGRKYAASGPVGAPASMRIILAMLLALDVGNTNVTVGVFRAGALVATRRARTAPRATPDELEVLLEGLPRLDGLALADTDAIVVASVVPAVTAALETVAARRERSLVVAGAGTVPIPIRVDR